MNTQKRKRGGQIKLPADADNPIAGLRLKTGWGQAELAEKLGTTQGTVSRYEAGKRSIPGPVRVLISQLLEQAPAALSE